MYELMCINNMNTIYVYNSTQSIDDDVSNLCANENEMEDNNIEKLDIAVDLEADDNLDVNQVFQNETTEKDEEAKEKGDGKEMQCNDEQNKNMFVEVGKVKKVIVDVELPKKGTNNEEGKMDEKSKECKHIEDAPSYSLGLTQDGLILTEQNVEAGKMDFDKVPEVEKTVYIQKEVEEINQQTDKGTRERDVDVVESRKTTVDANNEATNEKSAKNVDDNDGPSYSLGVEEVQKENEILVGEEHIETDIPLDVVDVESIFQSPGSPYKLFVGTNVIVNWMLNKTDSSKDERYERFRRNMYGGISGNKMMNEMKQFDIILFLILEHGHYYLLNFELKNGAITVIDNFHESIAPVRLKDSEDYFKKDSTYKINEVDCEIFVMRHMEKYMGIKQPFIYGLNSNAMKRKGQLNALRKKFAAHIL
ncbi:hypothetical protein L1987_85731 [Smallanthus sonchifolius]|uniref:Uncharacterized protein n=1 Tax=Smallanthus sonchifolius TaxID=185202 RepID=A0ACB8XYE6_9ASTR|nr:hypothetical protein L1987_85731 [Smallanthus sonchifolius]